LLGNVGAGWALPLKARGKELPMKVKEKTPADRPKRSNKDLKKEEEQRRKKKQQEDAETTTPGRTGPYDDPHRRPA